MIVMKSKHRALEAERTPWPSTTSLSCFLKEWDNPHQENSRKQSDNESDL